MTCVEIIQRLKDLAPVISAFMLLVVILLTGCTGQPKLDTFS